MKSQRLKSYEKINTSRSTSKKIIIHKQIHTDNINHFKFNSQSNARQSYEKFNKMNIINSQSNSLKKTKIQKNSLEKIYGSNIYESKSNEKRKQSQAKAIKRQGHTEMKWKSKQLPLKNKGIKKYFNEDIAWDDKSVPYSVDKVLQYFSHYLTPYELQQIIQYKHIYYIGHKADQKEKIDVFQKKWNNQQKEYILVKHDHIAYRYQLLAELGSGSYGKVFKVYDHKQKQYSAIKIIKNKQKFSKQALCQYKILNYIKQNDKQQQSNVVKIKDFIIFRKHICMVFQLLSDNLYQLIGRNKYQGLPQNLVRRIAIQLLTNLQFLRKHKIIHCDFKPQNILLRQFDKSGIKIIDFGSSCYINETVFTYIQSRFYRAPQIFLGAPYDNKIDMWSIGCILGQLTLGIPLFPGNDQFQQMKYYVDSLGMPPSHLINSGFRSKLFFPTHQTISKALLSAKPLEGFQIPIDLKIQNADLRDLIREMIKWDPKQRILPLDALNHRWIQAGLPQQLRFRNQQTSRAGIKQIVYKSKQKVRSEPKKINKESINKYLSKRNY